MTMRVGCLSYVNILPITHALDDVLGPERADFVFTSGSPSRLNALMAEGALDSSPISSIEYARHPDDYVLVPDLSISSRGAVGSVVLFSRVPLETLTTQPIGVCGATATSRVLLQILLEDFMAVHPCYREDATINEARRGVYPALLLIGDEALAFREAARFEKSLAAYHAYDLGELWHEHSGLPMVFAVWAIRRGLEETGPAVQLMRALHTSRDRGVDLPASLIDRAASQSSLSRDALRAYYGGMHYTLGPHEERALLTFFDRAAARGQCRAIQGIEFAGVREGVGGPGR